MFKLVFFNHSIPNTPEFNDAFKKHADFVEIKQLQCYPNFIDRNNSHKLFIRNNDFKDVYKINPLFHHLHFEYLCYNECFFENMDKFEHIAVFDQDESVIPRRIEKLTRLGINQSIDKQDYINNKCSKSNMITSYFTDLNSQLDSTGKYKHLNFTHGDLSYHFLMGLFVKHHVMDTVFNELEKYFKTNEKFTKYSFNITDPNDFNFRGKKGVSFNVLISSDEEYTYAKQLSSLYSTKVKPFILKNEKELNSMPEAFNRFYFLNGPTTGWMCGKTIHNTQMSHWVSNHYPEGNNFLNLVWTPHEYGHISHFRSSLKDLHERNISISHFNFDLNYFSCYFRTIAKELKYNIRFE